MHAACWTAGLPVASLLRKRYFKLAVTRAIERARANPYNCTFAYPELWLTLPVRNLWSLEPGECIVAEELLIKLTDVEVFFPVHDVGVDLLVVRGEKHVGIQVKESRYYIGRAWKSGHVGHSWHQLKRLKFERNKGKIDFYVFLTYLPILAEHKVSSFGYKFLIVPSSELERRMVVKDAGKKAIYSFCFHFQDKNVWDERVTTTLDNPLTDYSQFLNAWDLMNKTL
jgi:hypothetical protein